MTQTPPLLKLREPILTLTLTSRRPLSPPWCSAPRHSADRAGPVWPGPRWRRTPAEAPCPDCFHSAGCGRGGGCSSLRSERAASSLGSLDRMETGSCWCKIKDVSSLCCVKTCLFLNLCEDESWSLVEQAAASSRTPAICHLTTTERCDRGALQEPPSSLCLLLPVHRHQPLLGNLQARAPSPNCCLRHKQVGRSDDAALIVTD